MENTLEQLFVYGRLSTELLTKGPDSIWGDIRTFAGDKFQGIIFSSNALVDYSIVYCAIMTSNIEFQIC